MAYQGKHVKSAPARSSGSERSRTAGVIIAVVLVLIMLVLDLMIMHLDMLPMKYLLPLIIVLFIIVMVAVVLLLSKKSRASFIVGVVLAVLLAAAMLFGISAVMKLNNSMNSMTSKEIELADVAVYVNEDDPAEFLTDAAGYTFGILSSVDTENTQEAISRLEENLGRSVSTASFDDPVDLMDALFDRSVGAIILNTSYIDMIKEMGDYSDVETRIRELTSYRIEREVVINKPGVNKVDNKIFTLYISGIDSRTGLVTYSRSDVNIIATVNTETKQISLVNTPRDYFVPLPRSNGVRDKLTHAGIYGVEESMGALGMLYDIDIDYYFRLNFSGFENIIDVLGGITVHSDYTFSAGGFTFYEGDNDLNGEQALVFARERHAFAIGDVQRGKNQMEVIKAVLKKIASPSILSKYSSLLSAMEGNFETSVPSSVISELVQIGLTNGGGWNVVSYTVTGYDGESSTYSSNYLSYVMIPNEDTVDTAKELMHQVRSGETISKPE